MQCFGITVIFADQSVQFISGKLQSPPTIMFQWDVDAYYNFLHRHRNGLKPYRQKAETCPVYSNQQDEEVWSYRTELNTSPYMISQFPHCNQRLISCNKDPSTILYSVDLEVWSKLAKHACIKRIASKYMRYFDCNWQRVNAFSRRITLTLVLLPQIISYSATKGRFLNLLSMEAYKRDLYELIFLPRDFYSILQGQQSIYMS